MIYNRHNMERVHLTSGCELDWDEEISAAQCHDCVPVSSDHPLYILYTSGTTGTPKGVVRASGGYTVMLKWTMSKVYGLKPGEGKPVGTPDAGAYFRLLSDHGVVALFITPTALRVIRQQDPEAVLGRQYHFPRFRTLFVAGERCDLDTLKWAKQIFNVPVLDHWWQTETGSPISASCVGLGNSLNPPPGQTGRPVPGYNVVILGHDMKEVNCNELGNIAVKLPLPPGSLTTLWENDKFFKELYFTKYPGYYDTMDAGYMDNNGYLYVMSRVDDVINVAGHRISAGAIEESIISHPAVADCAVLAFEDPVKGHVPLALCVLKTGVTETTEKLSEEIVKIVRDSIGPVAAFRKTVFVPELPKTRSGKIPRSALSAVINGKPFSVTPTIEDPKVFSDIEAILKQKKIISQL